MRKRASLRRHGTINGRMGGTTAPTRRSYLAGPASVAAAAIAGEIVSPKEFLMSNLDGVKATAELGCSVMQSIRVSCRIPMPGGGPGSANYLEHLRNNCLHSVRPEFAEEVATRRRLRSGRELWKWFRARWSGDRADPLWNLGCSLRVGRADPSS